MMFFSLNLRFDEIAFRFNVNKGTVCSHKPLSFSCTSKLNIVIRNVDEYYTRDSNVIRLKCSQTGYLSFLVFRVFGFSGS